MRPMIYELWVPNGLGNHPGRSLSSVDYVTIHTTGNHNPTATAEAHARFQFAGGGGRQASWHYTVDSDEIWQSFRDGQMCWHTGTQQGNETSIGIEICVNSPAGFLFACERSAELTAYLLRQHGLRISDIRQHHDWSGKNCPSELRSSIWGTGWDDFLTMVSEYLYEQPSIPPQENAVLDKKDEKDEKSERYEKAENVINSLNEANIRFDDNHWRGVLTGHIRANREWTKTLTNRIIDNRWDHMTPKVIGSTILTLLKRR